MPKIGGYDITIDMNAITIREYRRLFADDKPDGYDDEILARACNLTVDQIGELGQHDYRLLVREFWRVARDPLASDEKN